MHKIVSLVRNENLQRIFTKEDLKRLEAMNVVMKTGKGALSADEMVELLADATIAITSWGAAKLEGEILKHAPNLKLVLHGAGSVKGVVTRQFWEKGIRLSSAADPLSKGVGETALGLTITSLKNMWQLSENTRLGQWSEGKNQVRELFGITVGVVGAGRAGRHYIRLLKNFDVDILIYDPTLKEDDEIRYSARQVSLEQLLLQSDVVSIHAPSIPETYHMFNSERLQLMKDNAILINTARGSLIDEAALVKVLEKGRLFACIDVTDPEPPAKDHPFRTLPNVVLLPHIAGAVNNGLGRIGQFVLQELERFLTGEEMHGEVKERELDILA